MTSDEVREWLTRKGRTSKWLAEACGYKASTLYNAINKDEYSEKMVKAINRAFLEEERRGDVDLEKEHATIWETVYFSGSEVAKIERARKAGGYDALPQFYHDAVVEFADKLLSEEQVVSETRPVLRVAEDPVVYPAKKNGSEK